MFHIVDDEGMMCTLITTVVSNAGYDVEHFYSGEAYLKYMGTRCYRAPIALLTDYMMPTMNGCELASAVRKVLPEQKIILISGMDGIDDQSLMMEDTFHACLAKPFHIHKLASLLDDLVSRQFSLPLGIAA